MQTLEEYIQMKYNNNLTWFEEECKQSYHLNRISKVLNNREYLNGKHKILQREDIYWKKEKFITTKLILQNAKTILNFHDTFLLGRPISLTGSEDMVKEYNKIYRNGKYNKIDFDILRKVNRYGDCFEYIYLDDNKNIKSKLINSEDGYPVFSEDTGEYFCFVEHYSIDSNKVSYYNIYSLDMVECWSNEGGELHKTGEYKNVSGLPIHYHNFNDYEERFGRSELEDIKGILDLLEDLLSKMTDSVYTLSLNPIPVIVGQQIQSNIPADACGFNLNFDTVGSFEYASCTMDYSTIKLLLDSLQKKLTIIAGMPSVAMGDSNISNVSEVSLSMLYSLASVKAMLSEKWLDEGFETRWEIMRKLLALKGVEFAEDDYISCEYNYSKPINQEEQLNNIFKQYQMGAISLQTIIEKSYLTNDNTEELKRIEEEKNKNVNRNENVINENNKVDDKVDNVGDELSDKKVG